MLTLGNNFLSKEGQTLDHPNFNATLEKTMEAILTPDGDGTVQIVGCTGVGKTHLRSVLSDLFYSRNREKVLQDLSYMPVASFTVRLLSKTGFSWAAFCEDYLKALKHPQPTSHDLKEARDKIIKAHQSRNPVTVIIDEAHHILNGCKDTASIRNQSEVLKSICEDTGTKLTLIGTYDLIPWLRTNGQAARRNRVVHFERYHNTNTDRLVFAQIISAIDGNCQEHLQVCLSDHEDLLFRSCLGLIGVLRNWLVRAKANASNEGEGAISYDALIATKPNALELTPILKESYIGEKLLTECREDIDHLNELLDDERHAKGNLKREDVPLPGDDRPKRRWPTRKAIRERVCIPVTG